MKTLFLSVSLCLMTVLSFGQNAAISTPKALPTAKTVTAPSLFYRCPSCSYVSAKPGTCPKDKSTLIKVGDYYCPECKMTSAKPGKCPMCNVDLKKMEALPTDKAK
jgi:rubrerythrin